MSNSQVGALHLKTLAQQNANAQIGALHLKTLAQQNANAQIGALHLKVLAQYPQPYYDGGNALKEPKTRLRNGRTRSN